ncbi:hypothetical protein HD553DRAFT_260338, partial [Filobasidium floriforme]|uniref:uncharacterized protein n=1 Tax=Filobasidium floriforme TaxID=5210 RepID=UPI001E8EEBAE
ANKAHPCHHCAITREDVNTARGYQWRDLPMRDPQKLLDAAYRHRDTNDPRERARIEERYGVRWSPMLELIGYQHSASNPVDPLHNSFLGMAKSLVNMLLANESLFKAGSGLKADQWKRVVQMLPIALYVAWREEESDDISFEPVEQDPDDEPAPPEPSTDRRKWYSTILSFCSGIRILHAHSITQQDADDGVQYLSNAAQSIIQLDGHLTPNWHIAMHYSQFVRLYGPLHGYGTWPFERNNGVLSRINHN